MTTQEIIDNELDRIGKEHRCLWQVCPRELPKDMPSLAMELWQCIDGTLYFFLFYIDPMKRTDEFWFEHVDGWTTFKN